MYSNIPPLANFTIVILIQRVQLILFRSIYSIEEMEPLPQGSSQL